MNQGVPVNSRTVYGWTPLHDAARYGRLNIVQELLKRGAIVNATTRSGRTPLYLAALANHPHINVAALANHPRIVHALIKAGANPKYGSNIAKRPENFPCRHEMAELP